MNTLANMSQDQKDQLLARLLAKEAAAERKQEYAKLGLSWSKNGFIVVKQGKTEDKSLPALYIAPQFVGKLASMLESIQGFAQDSDAKDMQA